VKEEKSTRTVWKEGEGRRRKVKTGKKGSKVVGEGGKDYEERRGEERRGEERWQNATSVGAWEKKKRDISFIKKKSTEHKKKAPRKDDFFSVVFAVIR
jgi:hypothetical protein